MKGTGIVRDEIYLQHEMGAYHPESPRRLEVIYGLLDENGHSWGLENIEARPALIEEISVIHAPAYVERIASTAGRTSTYLDPDTSTCAYSWEAASKAVGGLLNLVSAVVKGELRNGFAFVRPPGHHAEHDRAMGFCLFNNIAVAARYALNNLGLERVAVIDWDLHHGNGTQHSFYDDPRVMFISTHQYPHYPGTGRIEEVGKGDGRGYTLNVPFSSGAGDAEFVAVYHRLIAPVLESYKPELILVSAGFDAHERDPLGGLSLSTEGYEQMIQILQHLAAELCSHRIVLTLEGGYDLIALRDSTEVILRSLATYEPDNAEVPPEPDPQTLNPRIANTLRQVIATQQEHWKNIRPL